MDVKVARRADASAVAALLTEFRDFYGESEPEDGLVRATVERLLEDEMTEFLLAGEPPGGVAQIRFRLSIWTGSEDAWLEDLFVQPAARRRGLGRALAEACMERARARGCARIQLDCNQANLDALALYESLGFRHTRPERWGGASDLFLTRRL